jgi:hypothetical protein
MPTAQQAEKLQAELEAAAMKRLEVSRLIAESLEEERKKAMSPEELAEEEKEFERRRAEMADIGAKHLAKLEKILADLKANKEKKGGGSRKNKKRSKKTKRRSARK